MPVSIDDHIKRILSAQNDTQSAVALAREPLADALAMIRFAPHSFRMILTRLEIITHMQNDEARLTELERSDMVGIPPEEARDIFHTFIEIDRGVRRMLHEIPELAGFLVHPLSHYGIEEIEEEAPPAEKAA